MLGRRIAVGSLLLTLAATGRGEMLPSSTAQRVARSFVAARSQTHDIAHVHTLRDDIGRPVLHAVELAPAGFVLIAADSRMPPVVGHSLRNPFPLQGTASECVVPLLVADAALRLDQAPQLPAARLERRDETWQRLLARKAAPRQLTYWPAAGTTTTGGWVATQWSQTSPYNQDCPIDPVTATRSVAGCPAVAMAQLLNYHRTTNHTRLDDGDDYYHSYAGRSFWIDDGWAANGFPSFTTLAASLDILDGDYRRGLSADDAGAAALVFACGVAAEQVYTSSVSGTFGVAQAVQAYGRFGMTGFELLDEHDTGLYQRMEHDMKAGRPVHLAVVDPDETTGHNVVVDGYCSDGTYHVNFGWGGPYDGWYLLPDEMPYGLTVVEGAIVDLVTLLFADGFDSGDLTRWSTSVP